MIRQGDQRASAVAGLRQLPRNAWNTMAAASTAEAILEWAQGVPPAERTGQQYIEVAQLGNEFAGYLAPSQAAAVRIGLRELSVAVFVVKTIHEQMQFDTRRIVVEAGKPCEIIFENNDVMPHNLVFIKPDNRLEIGALAQVMSPFEPDDKGRAYLPKHASVIDGTRLLEPGQKETLKLTAPELEGVYEFVCTFPGHWTIMWGRIIVTHDVDGYLRDHPVAEPAGFENLDGSLE